MESNHYSEDSNNIPGTDTPKPKCKLAGEDGNIFSILGRARQTLISVGHPEKASEMCTTVTKQKSYDDALVTIMKYVDAY